MTPVPAALSHKFKNMAIVCAMLVVFIHIDTKPLDEPGSILWAYNILLRSGISDIAVPFFFLASGFFLAGHIGEEGWWKRELYKRIRTLLVPFVLWNVIHILVCGSVSVVTDLAAHRPFGTSISVVQHPMKLLLGLYPPDPPPLEVTWYINALFFLVLISPVIVWALKRFPWLFIFGAWASSILIVNLYPGGINCLRFWWRGGLAFFALGIFLRWHPIRVTGRTLWVWSVILSLALLAVRMGQSYTGMFRQVSLEYFSIPFMMYAVWGLIPAKPWAKAFTSLAFACYLMHIFVLFALHIVFIVVTEDLALVPNVPASLEPWLKIVLAVPLTLLLGHALYRYFPRAAALLFGGR